MKYHNFRVVIAVGDYMQTVRGALVLDFEADDGGAVERWTEENSANDLAESVGLMSGRHVVIAGWKYKYENGVYTVTGVMDSDASFTEISVQQVF